MGRAALVSSASLLRVVFGEELREMPWLVEAEGPLEGPVDAPASLRLDGDWPRIGAGRLSSAGSGMGEACDLEGSNKLGSSGEVSTICVEERTWGFKG